MHALGTCVSQMHKLQEGIWIREAGMGTLAFYLYPGWSEAELLPFPGTLKLALGSGQG